MPKKDPFLDFYLIWPARGLSAIAATSRQRTAAVINIASATAFDSNFLASGLAGRLVDAGTELFALVGDESEQAHDALDWALEDFSTESILTSWHTEEDPNDIASFVVASCRATGVERLLAAVDDSTEFGSRLKEQLKAAIRSWCPAQGRS